MDASTITLLAFSSALVLVSGAFIVTVNYRRCCKPVNSQIDWVSGEVVVSQNAAS